MVLESQKAVRAWYVILTIVPYAIFSRLSYCLTIVLDTKTILWKMEGMSGYALLWNKILRSSLWIKESKETRLVWIAMMALKDNHGKVYSSLVGLADLAKVSVDECREAIVALMKPDPDDTSGVEEGRRIREIEGGWQLINHDLYRFTTEAKREFWREQKREQRRVAAELDKLPGSGINTKQLAEKLREIHGPAKAQNKVQTKSRVLKQVAREEAIQERVRKKFNPGYDPTKPPEKLDMKPKEGLSQALKRQVANDPITKADRESLERLRGKKNLP